MHIHLYQPELLETTADLLHEMSAHYNGAAASSRETVRRNLVDNILGPASDVRLVVAAEASRVIGLATISIVHPAPKETGQLFMKELYVVADRRNTRVGQNLMRWIARYAVDNGCSRFDWTVDAANPRALAFYRELGATHVSEKLYFRFSGEKLAEFSARGNGSDD